MELKRYMMILWNWWWLVLVALVTTTVSTMAFTYTRTPEYETQVRLIVSPSAVTETDLRELRASITALDKPIVANTYAEISQSPSIIQSAWNQLELLQQEGFEVSTSVLQETNIIVITVTGPDPVLIQQLTTAIAEQTLTYVGELYEVYDLVLLDPAPVPEEPSSPNVKLNLALGIVLGLGLGVILAFLAEYLKSPLERAEQISILDPQTGAYRSSYFLRRLRGEISRAQRVERPFVVGMIRLEDFEEMLQDLPADARHVVLKQVVQFFRQTLPEENLVALWAEDTLVLLMPDHNPEDARQLLKQVQAKLTWTALEIEETGLRVNTTINLGLAEYDLNGDTPEALLEYANKSLQNAERQKFTALKLKSKPR